MADQWVALEAVLKKIEADVLKDLSELLIPGLLGELEHFLPAPYLPLEQAIAAALQPAMQKALADLIAKVAPSA